MRDHTCSWSSSEVSALPCSGLRSVVCLDCEDQVIVGGDNWSLGWGGGGGGTEHYLFLVF